MTDSDLAARVHRNLMDVTSWMAVDAEQSDGELLMASPSELPFLNIAMREASDAPAADFLARAREFFFSRGRGFVVYSHPADPALDSAAGAAGLFEVMARYPEMVCRAPLPALAGDVQRVTYAEDAAAYWAICDEAYPSLGMPPGVFTETFAPEDLLRPEIRACLGRGPDGRPVACALVSVTGDVGMVGWVGALPEARGRGLAAACTVWATTEAFAAGADVASLQASVMGEPIYERLGYEHLFAYRLLGAMPG
jgi:GNAT superfamily N-acetyltransferase